MIYGDFLKTPCSEDHLTNPKGIYGAVKLCGETLTKAFCNMYNIEWVIIRPAAVYGPSDANRRVTQIFIDHALEGKPLVLHNHGQSMLDFTYVDDAVQGFYLGAVKTAAKNDIFNITRGEGRTIKEAAEIVKKHIPSAKIVYKKVPKNEKRPERGALDICKAKKKLGYVPTYNLEDGMAKYIEFVKNFHK